MEQVANHANEGHCNNKERVDKNRTHNPKEPRHGDENRNNAPKKNEYEKEMDSPSGPSGIFADKLATVGAPYEEEEEQDYDNDDDDDDDDYLCI